LINETENDEEMHVQKVCRVITIVLKDNKDWKGYVTNVLDPIIELEKGKLCQQEERDQNSNSSNFDNNIFDDDFINGGAENNATDDPEDEDDHHKFFKKMQECFSNNQPRRRNSSDLIEIGEREEKTKAYAENNSIVKSELRNSLCDDEQEEEPFKRRDRSTSNENFGLPPLSSFDDNKDLHDNGMNINYKSNENGYGSNKAVKSENRFGVNLASSNESLENFEIVDENLGIKSLGTIESDSSPIKIEAASDLDLQIGHLEEIVPETPTDLDIDDVDIDLDDDIKDIVPEIVPSFDFFAKELLPEDTTTDEALIDF
jgi:hypothetical protein